MNAQWRGARGQNDKMRYAIGTTDPYKVQWANVQSMLNPGEAYGGVPKSTVVYNNATPPVPSPYILDPPLPSSSADINENDPRGAHYADTYSRMRHYAPPYILVRMEPYYQPDDTPIQIYAQMHVHYECTVEIEELDGYGNFYDPTAYDELGTNVTAYDKADNQLAFACSVGPCDNELDRIFTENGQAYNWA